VTAAYSASVMFMPLCASVSKAPFCVVLPACCRQSLSCRAPHSVPCSEPPGRFLVAALSALLRLRRQERRRPMHGLIYLIGLIVVILAILSFFGLR